MDATLNNPHQTPPVLGFAAYSGTGKTTLLSRLVPLLRQEGLHLGLIKHAHHSFDVDQPGKDSYVLRHAGAERVLIGSRRRWVLMVETPEADEPTLEKLLANMPGTGLDLILVEGFKHAAFPKIELHRQATAAPWLHPDDDTIIAIATDAPQQTMAAARPVLDLNQPAAIARFILNWLLEQHARRSMCAQQHG